LFTKILIMINYANLTTSRPIINYDTITLTSEGYELKFALDFGNSDLQKIIDRCKKNNWPYKIVKGVGEQSHVWIKGWIRE